MCRKRRIRSGLKQMLAGGSAHTEISDEEDFTESDDWQPQNFWHRPLCIPLNGMSHTNHSDSNPPHAPDGALLGEFFSSDEGNPSGGHPQNLIAAPSRSAAVPGDNLQRGFPAGSRPGQSRSRSRGNVRQTCPTKSAMKGKVRLASLLGAGHASFFLLPPMLRAGVPGGGPLNET